MSVPRCAHTACESGYPEGYGAAYWAGGIDVSIGGTNEEQIQKDRPQDNATGGLSGRDGGAIQGALRIRERGTIRSTGGLPLQPREGHPCGETQERHTAKGGAAQGSGAHGDPGGDQQGAQPAAYIIVLINKDITPNQGEVDAAAAIENMILAALEEGVGSCWLGAIDRQQLQEIFGIPQSYKVDSVLALGYPAESPVLEEAKDSIKYWKDKDGTLHVPKRKFNDVIHHNKF